MKQKRHTQTHTQVAVLSEYASIPVLIVRFRVMFTIYTVVRLMELVDDASPPLLAVCMQKPTHPSPNTDIYKSLLLMLLCFCCHTCCRNHHNIFLKRTFNGGSPATRDARCLVLVQIQLVSGCGRFLDLKMISTMTYRPLFKTPICSIPLYPALFPLATVPA